MTEVITVTGNITGVPERKQASNGDTMVKFGLASTERRPDGGRWVDVHTNFYSVVAYGKLAEHALDSLSKGQRVIVIGKLQIKKWENGERSGATADITARNLGPDLTFGVAAFTKLTAGGSTYEAPREETQEWHTTVPADQSDVPAAAEGTGLQPGLVGAQPELVGAQAGAPGWGAPIPDEPPF